MKARDSAQPMQSRAEAGLSRKPVLEVRNLQLGVSSRRGRALAVDGVGFTISPGQTLGLIGESGSGKSLTGLALIGLLPRPAVTLVGGEIIFKGEDLARKSFSQMRDYRGRHISMVLQDPLSALNPVLSIEDQICEALKLHTGLQGAALRERALELLKMMRIPAAEERLKAYPHQLSGGMRQRVVGAIAIAGGPEILIADEPTTALDVTVQAAYLDLLREIQQRTGLGMLFITHDFSVVGDICHDVAVMYGGRIVEKGKTEDIFDRPSHPYTKALLRSVPDVTKSPKRLASIAGSPPSVFGMSSGCRFHPRCWLHERLGRPERCVTHVPPLEEKLPNHESACHFHDEALKEEIDVMADLPTD
ncbi:MAG: ABC transporter ATP-binding protein [Pseudaminobacter sp.]